MKNVYLVQRLNAPSGQANPYSFGGGGKINGGISKEAMAQLSSVFSFDYMGSAEFEWGAVPTALDALLKLDLATFSINDQIWGFAPKEVVDEVKTWVKAAMVDEPRLKERLNLQNSLDKDYSYSKSLGWLKIEGDRYCKEPFMFFIDENMFKASCELLGVIS